jgi:hypothetical protein
MAYTGNVVRVYSVAGDSPQHFEADPRHAIPQSHETGELDPYRGVHQVESGTGAEYAGTNFPEDMAQGAGQYFYNPVRSHEGRAGKRTVHDAYGPNGECIRGPADTSLHTEDGQHRYQQHRYTQPSLQADTQVYSDEFFAGTVRPTNPNNTGATSVLRGINGVPQNNPITLQYPQGVRPGMDREGPVMRDQRRLGRRRYRYGIQVSEGRQTFIPQNMPPTQPSPGSSTWSLPSWLPTGYIRKDKTPAIFRHPSGLDTGTLAAPTSQEQSGNYGTVI